MFDVPCRLFYFYNGTVLIQNGIFCQMWYLTVTIMNIISLHLMALASVERYFLIFHHVFFARHHLFLSTLPTIIAIVYPAVWYITVFYSSMSWCAFKPNYSLAQCGLPCFLATSTFHLSFIICVHHLLPVFITTFANLYLIVTVLHQKAKMKRNNSWRKSFRMVSQLLLVAVVYLSTWLPHCILAAFPLFTNGETLSRT